MTTPTRGTSETLKALVKETRDKLHAEGLLQTLTPRGDLIADTLLMQFAEKAALLPSDAEPQEQGAEKIEILDALHQVFTSHGIVSRQRPSLITDVIQWAAQACRQSQPAAAGPSPDLREAIEVFISRQRDLPAEAAKVLRDNLWELLTPAPSTPKEIEK